MDSIKYIKDGVIKSFNIKGNKVCTSIVVGDKKVIYPTKEMMLENGYEIYIEPLVEPTPVIQYIPTIEELVENKIRLRYSINQEFQINRTRDTNPNAFSTYYNYVEECIAWAHEQEHREEESE